MTANTQIRSKGLKCAYKFAALKRTIFVSFLLQIAVKNRKEDAEPSQRLVNFVQDLHCVLTAHSNYSLVWCCLPSNAILFALSASIEQNAI